MTATRRRPAKPAPPEQRTSRLVFASIGGVLVAALIVAIVISMGGEEEAAAGEFGDPTVTGASLPMHTGGSTDAALGMTVPQLDGADFDGAAVTFGPEDGPAALLFLAHWCPHCQNEVPAVKAWMDTGRLPAGTSIVAVATGTDPARDNYPPSAWLEREGLDVPVIVDDAAGTVARAFGLSAFPYWVLVDAEGQVVARTTGSIPMESLEAALTALGS